MKVISVAVCLCAAVIARAEPPSSMYGAPSSSYGPPSSSYGAPSGGFGGGGYNYAQGGGHGGGDYGGGHASYNFMYEVQDAASGNDFGHMESRKGDTARGSYHVLLPDGRMQKVDYVADKGGYMPVVTYTGGSKGYGGGAPGGGYFYRR